MLDNLQAFMALGHIRLIVPRLVVEEFKKNRERVAKTGVKGIASQVQQVKDAVRALELNPRRRKALLAGLDDVKHKAPLLGAGVEQALRQVERLFSESKIVETSDTVKLAAAERALTRRAPCHHDNKNSIADAMHLETYITEMKAGATRERFAFVTHNKHDFSGAGDFRKPHPDIEQAFSKIKSLYFVTLSELLRRIDPSTFLEIQSELSWQQEPRNMSELQQAENFLLKQVWYNRHKNLAWEIEKGKHKVVPRDEWEANWEKKKIAYSQHHTTEDIWKGALRAARQTERELGADNVGPWTDFEWGMVNGKLSALRWVLGDAWDMLDT